MKLPKSKNTSKDIKANHNNKTHNKRNFEEFDTPTKIYEYQNRVHMIQRRINQKVKEEQKNIEKYLTKLNLNYQSLTSRNFYRNYQKFSKKYFKTTNLIDDIVEKYEHKGYIIPKLNHDFFKVNPLLDSNVNKLFISYLFNNNGEKINYEKFYKKNKGVKYMKKLKTFICPEGIEEEFEKPVKSKHKKAKSKINKIIIRENKKSYISENGLNRFLDINNHKLEKEENNKKNLSSRNINFHLFKGLTNATNNNKSNYSLFNKDFNNKINPSKNINSKTKETFQTERKKNRYDSHRLNVKQKEGLYLNLKTEQNKSRKSSNNLALLSLNTFMNKNTNGSNENAHSSKNNKHIFLNTEKNYKPEEHILILKTPRDKDKIEISSQDKSSNVTKPFTSTNNEDSSRLNLKIPSSKTKFSLKSFKINEFSVNSKRTKNSVSSKKVIITEYNSKNLTNPKLFRYSYTHKNKGNIKMENVLKDAIISPENKNKINSKEKKEESINLIYKQLKNGKSRNLENQLKNYLSKTKKLEQNEINFILRKYDYKNLKTNFRDLSKFINENQIGKKIERIYLNLNNNDYNKIESLLELMNNKDKEISKFEGKITKLYNQ